MIAIANTSLDAVRLTPDPGRPNLYAPSPFQLQHLPLPPEQEGIHSNSQPASGIV